MSSFGNEVIVSRWTLGSHAGTHVDAQKHFSAGPQTVDQLDPATLLGPCRVLYLPDIPLVTAEALAPYDLTGVTRLLLRTRNSRRWQEDIESFDEHFVGVSVDAAQLLVNAGITLLGVDGLSVESYEGNSKVHDTLLGAGVVVVEGLNLAEVPAGDNQLICAPLKLLGSDGAPARVWLVS
jgi:arylformamidase